MNTVSERASEKTQRIDMVGIVTESNELDTNESLEAEVFNMKSNELNAQRRRQKQQQQRQQWQQQQRLNEPI